MTTLTLTRPPGIRPVSLRRTRDDLVRHLHAQVRLLRPDFSADGSMVLTYYVGAPAADVRRVAEVVVKAPVTWSVS